MDDGSQSAHKRRKLRLKFEDSPPQLEKMADLIKIGNSLVMYKTIDTPMVWSITPYLEQLDSLVGMQSLKDSIFYQILYYIQNMHLRSNKGEYLHTAILGPPGCGKTTVARIIGKIYQAMGILQKNGPFKVATREDFISRYLGQTADRTSRLLNSCIGGVLFIDEVYALGPGQDDKDSFAREALDTLTGFLSEHSSDFACIVAGYEEEVYNSFFGSNNGLKSRFPWIHKIEEYSSAQLVDILFGMVEEMNWKVTATREEVVGILSDKELFRNTGRDIETFIGKCKMAHAKRVVSLDEGEKFVLTLEDLKNGLELVKKDYKPTNKEQTCMYLYI